MAPTRKNLRTCPGGHTYYKSNNCPVCPVCEEKLKPPYGFLSTLSAPARRALENKGIKNLQQLSQLTEKEILQLHGIGPTAIPKLRNALQEEGLFFKQ